MIRGIVVGQRIRSEKLQRARELRRNMTVAERQLWQQLRRNQLGGLHFRRQHIIDGYIVDFYCHAAALIVEVDGPVHLSSAARDRMRDDVLRRRGLRVLHFANEEVIANLADVTEKILSACTTGT